MKIFLLFVALLSLCNGFLLASSDPPELAAWMQNTTGLTGYGGLPANVQLVRYSSGSVYVSCSNIPAYSIGPWPGNPNTPSNQNFIFKIPRTPVVNTGTKTATSLGPIAVFVNGVVAFNAKDANSYNNQNVWHQNAVVVEAGSMDSALGHPAPGGAYHHHQNPRKLYTGDPSQHSSILGYSYDGYPIYGPYAFTNTNGTGGITRMRGSYAKRSITQRRTLPDGTALTAGQYGPDVSGTYPLGYYIEDFIYTGGSGDLDEYNGRFAVTPEYPSGTFAYYVTIDAGGASEYPYAVGPSYYGVVANENISSHGHVTVSESVTTYTNTTVTSVEDGNKTPGCFALMQNYPNPFNPATVIAYRLSTDGYVSLRVYDALGREVSLLVNELKQPGEYSVEWNAMELPSGVYLYRIQTESGSETRKLALIK